MAAMTDSAVDLKSLKQPSLVRVRVGVRAWGRVQVRGRVGVRAVDVKCLKQPSQLARAWVSGTGARALARRFVGVSCGARIYGFQPWRGYGSSAL